MDLRFYIQYGTNYGENLVLITETLGEDSGRRIGMRYLSEQWWVAEIDADQLAENNIVYSYAVNFLGNDIRSLKIQLEIDLSKLSGELVHIIDEWRDSGIYNEIFNTRPFLNFQAPKKIKTKKVAVKNPSHRFQVRAGEIDSTLAICIIGSANKLGNWSEEYPLILEKHKGYWTAKTNLYKEQFPIQYKIGVYDTEEKKVILYEQGANRVLGQPVKKGELAILNLQAEFPQLLWKGAGINVPVSALKTAKSWGVGDFTDLHDLVDWCVEAGLKLIQLLPVNDTIARHSNKDSYPYSAITAFGLHPIYLNVEKLGKKYNEDFDEEVTVTVEKFNQQGSLFYQEVLEIKLDAIRKIFKKHKNDFLSNRDWKKFYKSNKHWLRPYAAFCYLRDKYKTAQFSQWKEFANYSEELIDGLSTPGSEAADAIEFHYFTQFHLHLQLKDATHYAHQAGIAMKADLPIGVGRNSVDAWMYPQLFHLEMQAGAPPDAFAVKGQNWSFPTYNWEEMAADNFQWWRQRMGQLSNYFDAVRIDHVLGFFRIWSIPVDFIEGIMGRFVPANAIGYKDLNNAGIYLSENRLCEPFITEEILQEIFGDDAVLVKETFLNDYRFKEEFQSQVNLNNWLQDNPEFLRLTTGLFNLQSNVILLRDKEEGKFHFRIAPFDTSSWKALQESEKTGLNILYDDYFFKNQNAIWHQEGYKKLTALKSASNNMLLCAEDLGMVPEMVPGVLHDMQILSLQVERMPKVSSMAFAYPSTATYDTIVTPSTHDMSTMREWWEEDRKQTQQYFHSALGKEGEAPVFCEPWVASSIIEKHLQSPAILSVFLFQDLLAIDGQLRRELPAEERINIPADPDHYWNYRMHLSLENLLQAKEFNQRVKKMIIEHGR